jgi:hypothetical protein
MREVLSLYFDLIFDTVCSTDWLRRGTPRLQTSTVWDPEDWLVSSLSEVVLLTVVNLRSLNRQGAKGAMNVEALFQRGPVTDLLHFRKTTFRMI